MCEAPIGLQKLCEAPIGPQKLCEAPNGPQKLCEAPIGPRSTEQYFNGFPENMITLNRKASIQNLNGFADKICITRTKQTIRTNLVPKFVC